jgi:hypothetical protein
MVLAGMSIVPAPYNENELNPMIVNAPNNSIGFIGTDPLTGQQIKSSNIIKTPATSGILTNTIAAATALFSTTSLIGRIGIGIVVFIILGSLIYYRDKINIAGSFDFLNAIPMSVLLVAGGASFIVSMLIGLFAYDKGSWAKTNWIYWIIVPVLIYIVCFTVTLIHQSLSTGTVDAAAAASASVNPLMAGVGALVIGCSAYVRAPVISAFPIINSVKVVDDVISAEEGNLTLRGLGIGYWLWWFIFISLTGALGKAVINKS